MTQQTMAVRTDVQKRANGAPEVTNNNRSSKQFPSQKVTVRGKIAQAAHGLPRRSKQNVDFLLMLLRAEVQRRLQNVWQTTLMDKH